MLTALGVAAYYQGRWDEAVSLYGQASEASARAGSLGNAAIGEINIGEVLSDQGRLAEAEGRLRHALEIMRGTGYEWGVSFVSALLGRTAARAGRHDEASRLLAEAYVGFRRLRTSQDVLWAETLIAEARAFAGQGEVALEAADRLVDDLGGGGRLVPLLQRVRGYALAQLGSPDAAAAALEASADEARRQDAAFELALTLDALLALGSPDMLGPRIHPARRRERDEIVQRLDIVRLPVPPLAPVSDGEAAAISVPAAD